MGNYQQKCPACTGKVAVAAADVRRYEERAEIANVRATHAIASANSVSLDHQAKEDIDEFRAEALMWRERADYARAARSRAAMRLLAAPSPKDCWLCAGGK